MICWVCLLLGCLLVLWSSPLLPPCDGSGPEETGWPVATGSKSSVSSFEPQGVPVCPCQEVVRIFAGSVFCSSFGVCLVDSSASGGRPF